MHNETKSRLLLLFLLTIGATIFFGTIYIIHRIGWVVVLFAFSIFIILGILINNWHPRHPILKKTHHVLIKLFVYVKKAFDIVICFIATTMAYIFCSIRVIFPIALILVIIQYIYPALKYGFMVFIVLSFTSIIMVNYMDFLKRRMLKRGILGIWSREIQKKDLVEIAMYTLQPQNVHFIVLILYVIFLSVIAFMQLQCNAPLFSKEIDDAIWKAFLLFIAFTNMKKSYSESESDSKIMLVKLLRMCQLPKSTDKDFDNKNDKQLNNI